MFRGFHNFEIFNNLWQTIQDCVASAPGAPFQRHKTWLLLEHPGFAIDADCYNPELYRRSFAKLSSRPSPEYLIAQLCDRVPALAHNFFDTGDRISLKWKQLLSTFSHHPSHDHDDPQLKERYEKAINALYVDFEEQRKSDLYLKVEELLKCWQDSFKRQTDFYAEEHGEKEYYNSKAALLDEESKQAELEYKSLKSQVQIHEAAIYEFTSRSLGVLLQDAHLAMVTYKRYEAGSKGSGMEFYETTLEPSDWHKWFDSGHEDDDGWITLCVRDSTGSSGREGHLTISFKIRKVSIIRPWMERTDILELPSVGMRHVPKEGWSNGSLDPRKNKGSFPLLPIAMVVAKDITISNLEMTPEQKVFYEKLKADVNHLQMAFECFSLGGVSASPLPGSHKSSSSYDECKQRLSIHNPQIIGWLCTVIPPFPQVENKYSS